MLSDKLQVLKSLLFCGLLVYAGHGQICRHMLFSIEHLHQEFTQHCVV